MALVSAKGHKRVSESLGLQQPQNPGGTEPLLWAGLGVPPLTPETGTADPGLPFSHSYYCQTLSVAAEYFQAKCLPQANSFFPLNRSFSKIGSDVSQSETKEKYVHNNSCYA